MTPSATGATDPRKISQSGLQRRLTEHIGENYLILVNVTAALVISQLGQIFYDFATKGFRWRLAFLIIASFETLVIMYSETVFGVSLYERIAGVAETLVPLLLSASSLLQILAIQVVYADGESYYLWFLTLALSSLLSSLLLVVVLKRTDPNHYENLIVKDAIILYSRGLRQDIAGSAVVFTLSASAGIACILTRHQWLAIYVVPPVLALIFACTIISQGRRRVALGAKLGVRS